MDIEVTLVFNFSVRPITDSERARFGIDESSTLALLDSGGDCVCWCVDAAHARREAAAHACALASDLQDATSVAFRQ